MIPQHASVGKGTPKHGMGRIGPLALAAAAFVLTTGGRTQALLRVTPPALGLTIEDALTSI